MSETTANDVTTTRQESYTRFDAAQRFEHILTIVTFTGLALTGLPQRYAEADWAQFMITFMGGIESIRIMHRVFAVGLMIGVIYHGGVVSYKIFVKGSDLSMLPGWRDIRDAWQWMLFNLGLRQEHPKMPRYNFGEKAEYLALVWGTLLMVITGFMLWNPIVTSTYLPGSFIPAALFAHSAEAFLAVAAIVVWHMYNVHVKFFNRSMFTGKMSREMMEEEHGEYLEKIENNELPPPPPPEVIAKRRRIFIPYAIVMTLILVSGLVLFVTAETTAIETITPTNPDAETVALTVDADAGVAENGETVYAENGCAACHGENAEGAAGSLNVALAGIDLDFETFAATVRRGPADMPAYDRLAISDQEMADIYAWLQSLESN